MSKKRGKRYRLGGLARELNMPLKDLVDKLHEIGVEHVKDGRSTISEEEREQLTATLERERSQEKVVERSPEEDTKRLERASEPEPAPEPTPEPEPEEEERPEETPEETEEAVGEEEEIVLKWPITVKEFAEALNVSVQEVLLKAMQRGQLLNVNSDIPMELAEDIALEFDKLVTFKEKEVEISQEEEEEEQLVPRPPIVTVMGHVDHGKTTLLDAIRMTNVAEREYGGITQHIGAYQVEVDGRKITFIDTPGHEAFTTLRARGAQVTDIAVLVVAADDGVMPQTIEAINHARAAGVDIIVAINKIDKPNANIDRVKNQLAQVGLIPEEWGGNTIMVPISAKKRQNIDELLEMILLLADMKELKANIAGRAEGVVLESKLEKGRGPVATVIVQKGILRVGDPFVIGKAWGKVRAIINDRGERLKEAYPGTPVEIMGLSEVATAGDKLIVVKSEKEAKALAEEAKRLERRKLLEQRRRYVKLEDLAQRIQEGKIKELNIIVKADTQGSLEAINNVLQRYQFKEVRVKVIHGAIGNVSESDVMLAMASNALIIAFNTKVEPSAQRLAENEGIQIRRYRVIFELLEDIRKALEGLLEPEVVEVELGRAEVKKVFKISRTGRVAGCQVIKGKITRNAKVRVERDGEIIWEGELESLKRFKDDVKEVAEGYECGMKLKGFEGIKEGDIIIAYILEERKRSLEELGAEEKTKG